MIASRRGPTRRRKCPPRLRRGALIALHVLETCPLVPVDAFVHLAGLGCRSSAYQQLARLRRAGLADVRRVDPGYLVGERPFQCWTITAEGGRALAMACGWNPPAQKVATRSDKPVPVSSQNRPRIPDNALPRLMATYRLLAFLTLELGAGGRTVEVQRWEWPWVREAWSATHGKVVWARMPAGATLRIRGSAMNPDSPAERLQSVVLVSDLGTAPVLCYRNMLRRLAILHELCSSDEVDLGLIVATPDGDGKGTRITAWRELFDSIIRRHGACALRMRVVTWEQVAEIDKRTQSPHVVSDDTPHGRTSARGTSSRHGWPAGTRKDQLLHMIGRHPCLTVHQLALLLGTRVDRVRRMERALIKDGLLRRIEFEELPDTTSFSCKDLAGLGLVETTTVGRRRLAAWLGVDLAAASRYHGILGNDRRGAQHRWRLLRTLAHTLGDNAVFVAFAIQARSVRERGGTDVLAEWRSAAACERRHCKPDGYGCYVRDGVPYGFFLEYDRGTERARKYAAKLHAFYSYREREGPKDYDGFPTLLFVTTHPLAEERFLEQACRTMFIRGTAPLPILSTTTARISEAPEGVLSPIWRAPGVDVEKGTSMRTWPTRNPFGVATVPSRSRQSDGLGGSSCSL